MREYEVLEEKLLNDISMVPFNSRHLQDRNPFIEFKKYVDKEREDPEGFIFTYNGVEGYFPPGTEINIEIEFTDYDYLDGSPLGTELTRSEKRVGKVQLIRSVCSPRGFLLLRIRDPHEDSNRVKKIRVRTLEELNRAINKLVEWDNNKSRNKGLDRFYIHFLNDKSVELEGYLDYCIRHYKDYLRVQRGW